MTRTARIDEPGLAHHVMAQGMNGCTIFRDDTDRRRFLRRAIPVAREMGAEVLAWALLRNHLHLVLETTSGPLSGTMQRMLGSHAMGYNNRHGRKGRLFRDRFLSRPVEDEDDLVALIQYVMLNPLRAGTVNSIDALAEYPWTSFAELMAPPSAQPVFVNRPRVLALFGLTEESALDELASILAGRHSLDVSGIEFSSGGLVDPHTLPRRAREDLRVGHVTAMRLRDERIADVLSDRQSRAVRRVRLAERGWTLDRCVRRAAELCGADERRLRDGGRCQPESQARSLLACFAQSCLGVTDSEVARASGVSRQAVTRARLRGAAQAEEWGLSWRGFFGVDSRPPLDQDRPQG